LDSHEKQLYSGLTAEVEIETHRHANILKIPSQSVLGRRVDELPAKIRDGNPNVDTKKTFTTVAYRYKDGKAVVTPIIVGSSDATDTIIRSGLGEDDRVITGPYKALEKLKHDQRVEDERESAATKPAETRPADEAQSKPSAAGTGPT
jgi:HlyD family secretion protein